MGSDGLSCSITQSRQASFEQNLEGSRESELRSGGDFRGRWTTQDKESMLGALEEQQRPVTLVEGARVRTTGEEVREVKGSGLESGDHVSQRLVGQCKALGCCSQKNGASLQRCKQKILSFRILLDTHKRMLCKNNHSLVSRQYLVPGRYSVNIC